MNSKIIPDKYYLPSEIAKHGFIENYWNGSKITNKRTITRLCHSGKLKSERVKMLGQSPMYQVLGTDIIEYKRQVKEKKAQALKKTKPLPAISA